MGLGLALGLGLGLGLCCQRDAANAEPVVMGLSVFAGVGVRANIEDDEGKQVGLG